MSNNDRDKNKDQAKAKAKDNIEKVNKDILKRVDTDIWDIPTTYQPNMRVPGRLFLSEKLLGTLEVGAMNQVANVATLPGIQKYSMAMPDVHYGYGFPIGGVAAFDEEEGVISPGGVGFDINCGVRLLRTNLTEGDMMPLESKRDLIEKLFHNVPSGIGSKSNYRASNSELADVFKHGVRWAVENGFGVESDIEHCEGGGCIEAADPTKVGEKAYKRGRPQIGTLGSGNHFLEIQVIDKVYDEDVAKTFGLCEGMVTVMVHCGSRGAGHQICDDNIKVLRKASVKYGIELVDKQLACAPIQSKEAQDYFGAMSAAANYAWANRQMITHWVRETFESHFSMDADELGMDLVYDVAHNVAKREEHVIDGIRKNVYVHRKGATRAFPPGHSDVPSAYRDVGQPVIIPGSMGTASYVLHGTQAAMELTFGSACHGAGRALSRKKADHQFDGNELVASLAKQGITIRGTNPHSLAEEAPDAYKSSSDVVNVVHDCGIAKKVVRMRPIAVAKG